jgi:hypothetical protein
MFGSKREIWKFASRKAFSIEFRCVLDEKGILGEIRGVFKGLRELFERIRG